jgi:hypothetical protein
MNKLTGLPAWLAVLAGHLAEIRLEPGVHQVVVRHDDACGFWSDGACDCGAEIISGDAVDALFDDWLNEMMRPSRDTAEPRIRRTIGEKRDD